MPCAAYIKYLKKCVCQDRFPVFWFELSFVQPFLMTKLFGLSFHNSYVTGLKLQTPSFGSPTVQAVYR